MLFRSVNDYKEHLEQGEPTNTYDVNGFYIGYNGRVNKLVDFVAPDVMYVKDLRGTWTIGYKINNYAVIDEKQEEADGFGFVEEVRASSYVNNMQITGAQSNRIQIDDEQAQEVINEIRQQLAREQNTQTIETVSGFGENQFGGDAKTSVAKATIDEDALPF